MPITDLLPRMFTAAAGGQVMRLTAPVEIQAAEDGQPTFSMRAYNGGPVNLFVGRVVFDLAGLKAAAGRVKVLRDHNPRQPVGHATEVNIGASTIDITGTFSAAGSHVDEVIESGRNGFPWEASVGVHPDRVERLTAGRSATVNGQKVTGPAIIVRKGRLKEVSFVAMGADEGSAARVAASQQREDSMDFDQWLESNGWDKSQLNAAQLQQLQAAYNAEQSGGGTATVAGDDDPVAAERQRQAAVMRASANHPQIQQRALSEGWDQQRTETEVLRANRPTGLAGFSAPYAATGAHELGEHSVSQAALMAMAGYEDAAAKIGDGRALQAARDMRLTNLRDWDRFNANITGEQDTSRMEANFSSASLDTLMSSISRMLLQEFELTPASCDAIAAWRQMSDFKEASLYRLLALTGGLEEVGDDGEIKHGKLQEFDARIKLATYAKLFGVSRKTIINDDVQVIASIPRVLAMEASRLRAEKFAALLTENPGSFFGAGNSNNIADPLTFDGLDAAIVKMRTQKDEDGRALNLQPTTLLVHPEQESKAANLLESTELSRQDSSDLVPTGNPMRRRNIRLEVEPRLATTTEWYLWSRPGDAALVVGTLNGNRVPSVETSQADFNKLGQQVRGYYDFAIALAEPRAVVRSSGDG